MCEAAQRNIREEEEEEEEEERRRRYWQRLNKKPTRKSMFQKIKKAGLANVGGTAGAAIIAGL